MFVAVAVVPLAPFFAGAVGCGPHTVLALFAVNASRNTAVASPNNVLGRVAVAGAALVQPIPADLWPVFSTEDLPPVGPAAIGTTVHILAANGRVALASVRASSRASHDHSQPGAELYGNHHDWLRRSPMARRQAQPRNLGCRGGPCSLRQTHASSRRAAGRPGCLDCCEATRAANSGALATFALERLEARADRCDAGDFFGAARTAALNFLITNFASNRDVGDRVAH